MAINSKLFSNIRFNADLTTMEPGRFVPVAGFLCQA